MQCAAHSSRKYLGEDSVDMPLLAAVSRKRKDSADHEAKPLARKAKTDANR